MASWAIWKDVTPSSSLRRAHAPDPNPSHRLWFPSFDESSQVAVSPCWEIGPSRRYLHNPCMGAWTRTPPRSTGAFTRFVPDGHRPHLSFHRFGAQNPQRRDFYVGPFFRGCSHFLMFRLPYSLGPLTAPTAVGSVSHQAAGPFTPRNGRAVACSNCGIATCLNRVINMTGLAPVGLWPCRPLPEARRARRRADYTTTPRRQKGNVNH